MNQAGGTSRDAGVLDDSTLEIEPAPARTADVAAPRQCENCGATLAGQYCAQCGQRHHGHPVHHFWHFIGEATEDLTHADSRLWQTLFALLFRPGFLTREFLDGRRVRYLPPVRLYLVVSVLFFLVVGLHSRLSHQTEVPVFTTNGSSLHYRKEPAEVAAGQVAASAGVAHSRAQVAQGIAADLSGAGSPAANRRSCQQAGSYIARHAGWFERLGPRVTQNCLSVGAKGGTARLAEAIERNLERAMFLFLPLLALAMKPLYLKPHRYYVEHLLFFLHNHAFLFVVLGLDSVIDMLAPSAVTGAADTAITIYIPIYFYLSMRRVYGQARGLTLAKLAGLGIVYFFLGVLMLTATVSYSFLMM